MKVLVWSTLFIVGLYKHANDATECTARGRFPNNLSNDCRGYTMCLSVLTNFTKIDLVCPEHSIYSHLENQCTNITSYQCLPKHNCSQLGDFPNPITNDCGSYVSCIESMGNIVTARLVECPPNMLFDPVNSTCVNDTLYRCEVPTTETPKMINVSVKYSPAHNAAFLLNTTYNIKCYNIIFSFFVYFMLKIVL